MLIKPSGTCQEKLAPQKGQLEKMGAASFIATSCFPTKKLEIFPLLFQLKYVKNISGKWQEVTSFN